ncbi:uncharacterized protein F4807DRAFT_416108 [Annulohypoxylon truncatum]|uniref:uncharacterized protein n=1 Tax=Annulohypoxylon truncatum TaxID=327061 RepID=UPI0020073902|nr:uncharacterized protein F4807DRAFT_416108 [Annulohypoxylon truncatum]KAI1212432.1 hypothetical protein F4807DRAFT_416108 [Annulohypoxylon truncatum]
MTDWKGIVKHGWHPEKEGTSIKDQMKGLVGRGDNSSSRTPSSHTATPITSLRDPSSFGPPPKHVGAGARSPASATPQHQPHAGQTYGVQQTEESPIEAKPYQVDTTGLSTSHLPPPPGRKASPLIPPPSSSKPSGPPSLPPRLPPRSGNTSPVQTQSPASIARQSPYLNQGAINRLGAAGISVPGLGIGGKAAPPPPPNRSGSNSPSAGSSTTTTKTSSGRLSELQNRFSRFGSGSPKPPEPAADSGPAPSPSVPTKGTTWAEKQAALKTAAKFKKDPTSVSFSDAKAAASTAHNFNQRHGDQVASGVNTANGLGQRFGMFENNGQNGQGASSSPMGQISVTAGKKPPPPPPTKKKPPLLPGTSNETSAPAPPPIPIGTRPRFN